nr:helix-turn-helix transcriptional regulator [Bacillus pumilus]
MARAHRSSRLVCQPSFSRGNWPGRYGGTAARLSKSHFTREFKKATGFTPIHYLTNIRLEKAETLLKTTKYSIEEIAIQCGYRNANYLNKVFRKKIGMSPKQLRETSDA